MSDNQDVLSEGELAEIEAKCDENGLFPVSTVDSLLSIIRHLQGENERLREMLLGVLAAYEDLAQARRAEGVIMNRLGAWLVNTKVLQEEAKVKATTPEAGRE